MAKVELKQPVVEEISSKIKDAQSAVLVDARGLTVAQDTELRRALRKENVTYKVYKNTMMKRAFDGTDFAQLDELLNGPSALAVSVEDPAAPARVLCKFAKTAKALEVKGGVVEGKFYDQNAIQEIAEIPSRDELLSKLLGSIQSPITNFARVVKHLQQRRQLRKHLQQQKHKSRPLRKSYKSGQGGELVKSVHGPNRRKRKSGGNHHGKVVHTGNH